MRTSCLDCPKRSECTEPCEWLKAKLKEVTVPQRKQDIPFDEECMLPVEWPETEPELKTLIIQMHLDGYSSLEIAYHLPCSGQYIRKVVATNYVNKRADIIRKKR